MLHSALLCALFAAPQAPTVQAPLIDLSAGTTFDFGSVVRPVGAALGKLWFAAEVGGLGTTVFTLDSALTTPAPFPLPFATPLPSFCCPGLVPLQVTELSSGRALIAMGFAGGQLGAPFQNATPTLLLSTDGTLSGTFQLPVEDPSRVAVLGNRAYFAATDPANGRELWSTDGTPGGTALFEDLTPGPNSSGLMPLDSPWVATGQRLFLQASQANGSELRSIDLGASSTTLLIQTSYDLAPRRLQLLGDRCLFAWPGQASAGFDADLEPFVSDGTVAGTFQLGDLAPGSPGSSPVWMAADSARAYFHAESPGLGRELWSTDGTVAGTTLVADLESGPGSGMESDGIGMVTPAGLWFVAEAGAGASENLWLRPAAGTAPQPVLDAPGGAQIRAVRELLPGANFGLVTSSATSAGAVYAVGSGAPSGQLLVNLPVVTGTLAAFDGRAWFAPTNFSPSGWELWSTDGSPAGTAQNSNLQAPTTADSRPDRFVAGVSQAYFRASVDGNLRIYATDGTQAGTKFIQGLGSSADGPLAALGDLLLFSKSTATGLEPWISSGTAAGTFQLADIAPGATSSLNNPTAGVLNNRVYFPAQSPGNGIELWSTDGTSAGTQLVVDATPGAGNSFVTSGTSQFATAGERLFYTGRGAQGFFPNGLWSTDGTAGGTLRLGAATIGSPDAILSLIEHRDRAWFGAIDFTSGAVTAWSSDGSDAGTTVGHPALASLPGGTLRLASLGDRLLVFAAFEVFALEADGVTLTSLTVHSGLTGARAPIVAGDRVYFEAATSAPTTAGLAAELWSTDGTVAGTAALGLSVELQDPLAFGSDGRLFASQFAPESGYEPWTTDGAPNTAQLLSDALPGVAGSDPGPGLRVAGNLIYAGFETGSGLELHSLSIAEFGGYVAEPYGQGCGIAGPVRLDLEGEARLGQAVAVTLETAAPTGSVQLYASGLPTQLPIGSCSVLIGSLLQIGTATVDAQGSAALPFQLSTNPFWVGRELYLQALVIAPGGPVGGLLELTNGLELVFGQ